MTDQPADSTLRPSVVGCWLALAAGFFGWFFAGPLFAISSLVMRDAASDLLGGADEATVGRWFGWLTGAFLLGAATGGYLFGWIGDRYGRAKALGLSIVCYSTLSASCYFVQQPWQLLAAWYLAHLGVGGVWPNAIALVCETWPNVSRPVLCGVIGTSTNLGIVLFAWLCTVVPITPQSWRWVFLISAAPVAVGAFVLLAVPESPRWLGLRKERSSSAQAPARLTEILRPPLLRTTVLGIALGAVPLFGGWGSSNWANAWAGQIGESAKSNQRSGEAANRRASDSLIRRSADPPIRPFAHSPDPGLKARVLISRALPGSLSSLLGGALAVFLGRRRCYFLLSLGALGSAQYLFWFLRPDDPRFLWWNGALGLFSGFFFGWLPLCLPELFPTRVRSTGAGVSYNFGRIVTAFGVLVAAQLLKQVFGGDYAAIGRLTSLVYALGMVVILFVPATMGKELED